MLQIWSYTGCSRRASPAVVRCILLAVVLLFVEDSCEVRGSRPGFMHISCALENLKSQQHLAETIREIPLLGSCSFRPKDLPSSAQI